MRTRTFLTLNRAQKISTSPFPPSKDPFYTAPPNFEAAAPGSVLRVRAAPDVTKILPNCSAAYNILYRTTDSRYKPTWAVTTLYLPLASPINGTNTMDSPGSSSTNSTNSTSYSPGSYLLSYQTPYDSANVDLSPSYTVYGGGLNIYGVPALLGRGWYINVPDYEGPNASFTAGVQSGHATLDSVRAVLNSGFGLSPDVKYAMSGYSGGALASEWAAELQVQYAPELSFVGAALGGLTPNSTSVLLSINGGRSAELIPNGILGLASQFPDVEALLISQLKPTGDYNASTFLGLRTGGADYYKTFNNQDISRYFINGLATLSDPVFKRVQNTDGTMGYHGVPQFPLFVYKSTLDEISAIVDTDTLVARYCGVGADILYERNVVGSHTAEFVNGNVRQAEWIAAAFEGRLVEAYGGKSGVGSGCTVRDVRVGS